MKNENCLEGMMCPKCGQADSFVISVHTPAEVTDDGAVPTGGPMEWFDDSYCECGSCRAVGVVSDFTIPGFSVTFEVYSTLGLEMGESDRRGWWMPGEWLHDEYPGELAFEFDPDDYDPEEHDSLDEAIIQWAVRVLRTNGATHPNQEPSDGAEWWSTEDEVLSYGKGTHISKAFHFENFTDEQREQINQELS